MAWLEELVVARNEKQKFQYFVNKMDIFQNEVKIKELLDKIQLSNEDLEWLKKRGLELETKINDLTEQSDKLLRQIASSGYDDLKIN